MTTTQNHEARLNFRLSCDIKDRIERAAYISGQSVSDFAASTLARCADDILERQSVIRLANADRDFFLALLDANEAASETDRAAAAPTWKSNAWQHSAAQTEERRNNVRLPLRTPRPPGIRLRRGVMNRFLKEQARQDAEKGLSRTFINVAGDGRRILGYYTFAIGFLDFDSVPEEKRLSRHPAPVILLARLAVDKNFPKSRRWASDYCTTRRLARWRLRDRVGLYAMTLDAREESLCAYV